MDIQPFAPSTTTFLLWMINIHVRALFILALAGIILFLLRRSSAAIRHLILSIASATLLALPLMALLLPSWSMPNLTVPQVAPNQAVRPSDNAPVETTSGTPKGELVPSSASSVVESQPSATVRAQSPMHGKATGRFISEPETSFGVSSRTLFIMATVGFFLWVAGTGLLFLRLIVSLIRLRRMVSESAPATTVAPLLQQQFSVLSSFVRLRQPARLLIAPPELPGLSPMTWGLRNPIVLLPAESSAWPPERLRPVLLHELAHIQRGDWGTELMTRIVCALYWPNPLVWMLLRRLQKESEHACDDTVLRAGIRPAEYAQQLIEVLRGVKAQKEHLLAPTGAVRMAHEASAAERVRAILAEGGSRRPATVRVAAVALVAAVSLLVPLASLHRASAGNPQDAATGGASIRISDTTFYNGALPMARLMRRMAQAKLKMSLAEYRRLADARFAPGSDRFQNGLAAEGLYVSGIQTDGTVAAWDRNGNLLARGPNWRGSELKVGELRFQIERLKLPGTPAWIDKTTFDNLKNSRAIETEFSVVGVTNLPNVRFDLPGSSVDYGNDYFNFTESVSYAPGNAAKVDLYLTTSCGPWQTLAKSKEQAVQTPVGGGDIAVLSPLVTRRNGVEAEVAASLPARFLSRDANGRPLWSLRLEPVDAAGSAIVGPRIARYNETPEGSPVARLRFRFLTSELPVAKVASVRLSARPAQTLYFRNVPTKPISSH